MAQLAREVLAVPPELRGFVVAKPALEIPKISAKAIKDTTELRMSNKVRQRKAAAVVANHDNISGFAGAGTQRELAPLRR